MSPLFRTITTRLCDEFVAKMGSVSAVTIASTKRTPPAFVFWAVSGFRSGSVTGLDTTAVSARADRERPATLIFFFSGTIGAGTVTIPFVDGLGNKYASENSSGRVLRTATNAPIEQRVRIKKYFTPLAFLS